MSTRVLQGELLSSALDKGFRIACIPFIATSPLPPAAIRDRIAELGSRQLITLFTSPQGVINTFAQLPHRPDWKAFAISGATRTYLLKHLPADAILAHAIDARSLVPLIMQAPGVERLTFFCGRQHSPVLPDALRASGVAVEEVLVYETQLTPQKVTQDYDAYLFFSPSAVRSFFIHNTIPAGRTAIAIGATTANALQQLHVDRVLTAAFPDEAHVLEQMYTIFESI